MHIISVLIYQLILNLSSQEKVSPNLDGSQLEDWHDVTVPILTAYKLECTAEAQEVTVARAIELKHKPDLISALAHETR